MRRTHVLVDVAALMYHGEGSCPVIVGHHVRAVRRGALDRLQLDACAVCIPGRARRLARWWHERFGRADAGRR